MYSSKEECLNRDQKMQITRKDPLQLYFVRHEGETFEYIYITFESKAGVTFQISFRKGYIPRKNIKMST